MSRRGRKDERGRRGTGEGGGGWERVEEDWRGWWKVKEGGEGWERV